MFKEWFDSAWTALFLYLVRPMWKWAVTKATGKCELLRITYGEQKGSVRTKKIEKSLKLSNVAYLKELCKEDDVDVISATREVMKIKCIVPEVHSRFENDFQVSLCQICGYNRLKQEAEMMRKTAYSSENSEHEEKLLQLWGILMPDTKLESRICKQWTQIGFQGEDPKTDFRGMGMLGLNQLLYFAIQYQDQCKQVLSHSHHPKYWYSFAIVGINVTNMLYESLMSGYLRTHFYNIKESRPLLQDLHDVYCFLFHEFDKFWISEEPRDIMEFSRIRDKFIRKIKKRLKSDQRCVLLADFQAKKS